tara:strand:+ start:1211 stop:2809 length:1599 start_codon:yes stop_codon:yes gene_type:complete
MSTIPLLFQKANYAKKPKFYAVKKGHIPGIYKTWDDCKLQVDKFPSAMYKSFETSEEAEIYLSQDLEPVVKVNKQKFDITEEIMSRISNISAITDIQLSPGQQTVYQNYLQGKNIFMTGPGGTGKSKLIQYIVNDAKQNNITCQVCALTGCAAVLLNCNAKTIHSWGGIGLGKGNIEFIVQNICKNRHKKKRWTTTDLLIIDEVSMMSVQLFELLNLVAQRTRKSREPFGGMQVIFSGDFYQLPPVGDEDDIATRQYCFESPLWESIFNIHVKLDTMFRQRDPKYIKILNQIRCGKISKKTVDILNKHIGRKPDSSLNIQPTLLYPVRTQVDRINQMEMNKLGNVETVVYNLDSTTGSEITDKEKIVQNTFTSLQIINEIESLKNSILGEHILTLKVGAQVMCIANIDMESDIPICNGSQGIITCFSGGYPVVKFNSGVERVIKHHEWSSDIIPGICVKQIPLILAWAITIHKSQGATLDAAEIDIGSGIFEAGQTYVALSRIKSLDGLYLKSFDPNKICAKKIVNRFYETF